MLRPLAIDLFCGLGGWTEGLLAEGYRVVGFDVERHVYGEARYPAQLVLQDVLTMHGAQFKDAALIIASPPCQAYSYRAMPWKRAKALPPPDNSLFEACFRIQREACEAAGRYIPLVVENVCGAQKWVGRAKWHFGSFYLWGDVPALMPITRKAVKVNGFRFDGSGGSFQTASVEATKVGGFSWSDYGKADYKAKAFNGEADKRLREGQNNGDLRGMCSQNAGGTSVLRRDDMSVSGMPGSGEGDSGIKLASESGRRTDIGKGARLTSRDCGVEVKQGGDWFNKASGNSISRRCSSRSVARKAASAHIAKIPLVLSRHIARAWHPDPC